MSEQRKKVFVSRCFEDMTGKEDVICLYDTNHIPGAREATFDIKRVASSENSPMIACKIHINKITGQVSNIIPGTDPDTGREYELLKIRDIVNSTELIKGQQSSSEVDYGRYPLPQIISITMNNYTNRDKLRFIPPSESNNAIKMSNWIIKLMKNDPNVKGLQCFRWGNRNHVGLVAIDADRLRNDEIGSVAFFDGQGAFHDGSEKAIQNRYSQGETIINENGTINESSFLCNLYSIISDENKKGSNDYTEYTELNKEILKSVFGELSGFMEGFKEGVTLPVNMEPLLKCVGEKNGETDCSYWLKHFIQ